MVSLPCIAVSGPRDGGKAIARAVSELHGYEWVAFTSANAVDAFLAELDDARKLAGARLAAVGAATAAALAAAHLVADLVPEVSSADGLVGAIGSPTGDGGNGSVLFCRAEDALPTLAEGLREKGWSVDEVEAYRTVVSGPDQGATPQAVDRARGADAVVFASPSAVRAFVSLVGKGPRPSVAVCIGSTTATEARVAGFDPVFVAQQASDAGLVAAVVEAHAASGSQDERA